MIGQPRPSDWIIPAVLLVLLATALFVVQNSPPFPGQDAALFLLSGLLAVCFLVGLANGVRWSLAEMEHLYYQHKETRSITPLLRAAQAVRQLTPEQVALIPRFLPDDAQVVYVDHGKELEAHFYTEEGLVPWDFIESFLLSSNNVYLMAVNTTNDKTPERVFCQAMTNVCVRKGWAVPATGPHPAMWKNDGRSQASKFFHIELRNGTGYKAPETEDDG